jgi:hypothetical protein
MILRLISVVIRVVLLSNGLKKRQKQQGKDEANDKDKDERMLLGVLQCQTGGGAHCVLWREDQLYAGACCAISEGDASP